jgi:hypothetical protein
MVRFEEAKTKSNGKNCFWVHGITLRDRSDEIEWHGFC